MWWYLYEFCKSNLGVTEISTRSKISEPWIIIILLLCFSEKNKLWNASWKFSTDGFWISYFDGKSRKYFGMHPFFSSQCDLQYLFAKKSFWDSIQDLGCYFIKKNLHLIIDFVKKVVQLFWLHKNVLILQFK